MKRHIWMIPAVAGTALVMMFALPVSKTTVDAQAKAVMPIFEVDYKFPALPDTMVFGGVGGATADSHGNVWVFHRQHTLEEGTTMDNGYKPAPPVVEFDANGKYLQGWGGPSKTGEYQWTNRGGLLSAYAECASCSKERRGNGDGRPGSGEHGITVDYKDNVWLGGNGDGDGQILKFTKDGKFLMQIGHAGVKENSNDIQNLSRPSGAVVYQPTNEVFVSDGYGNRRVVVFDADTGRYKRHWGAYGNKPDDAAPRTRIITGPGPQQFNTPHGITISRDGIVYVADRANNRVQSFKVDGTFIKEGYNKRESKGTGTAFGVALSQDPQQRFIYIADGSNDRIAVMDRASMEVIGQIGRPGRLSGQFFHIHSIATDPQGNIITGESQGYRVQKFIYKGLSNGTR